MWAVPKMSSEHAFTHADLWIVGTCLPGNPSVVSDGLEEDEAARVEHFNRLVRARLWFTYRRGFAPLGGSGGLTTDDGWGCMLRTGQMMVAEALVRHLLPKDWSYSPDDAPPEKYGKILRSFLDSPSDQHPFSIHNLLRAGACFKKKAGTWFGPSETCHMMRECLTQSSVESLCCVMSNDGVLYLDQIESACSKVISRSPSEASSPVSSKRKRKTSGKFPKIEWRACVLLIPLRLGLAKINPDYVQLLLKCFGFPQSIGIMVVKPNSSYYVVGSQDERLFYLDPHQSRAVTPIDHDLLGDSSEYHCSAVYSMAAIDIDPSLAIGFYCRDKADFDDFWGRAQQLSSPKCRYSPSPRSRRVTTISTRIFWNFPKISTEKPTPSRGPPEAWRTTDSC
eukprot:441183_1